MPTTTIRQTGARLAVAVPSPEQIRARAYQPYMERGQQPGHAMDDWLQAEYELLQLPVHKLAELGTAPTHRVGLRGIRGAETAPTFLRLPPS